MKTKHDLSYRIAAVDSASPIGLLLAMYDTLAGDLLRAAGAIRSGDIELRCAQLNHAYRVLGQLESWLDADPSNKLTASLVDFYGYLRARMLEASIKQSASMLADLVEIVLQVRATWQQRAFLSNPDHAKHPTAVSLDSAAPSPHEERVVLSHSA